MKIAYISYECPPDTADGGIATYVRQAADMMVKRGHTVEVFAASRTRQGMFETDGVLVHRVLEPNINDFSGAVGHVFAARHAEVTFDVVEGPDYGADASKAVKLVPQIPLVVKTHGPSLLMARLNLNGSSRVEAIADFARQLGSQCKAVLDRRNAPALYFTRKALRGPVERDFVEAGHARQADVVASPCLDLCKYVVEKWGVAEERVKLVPNPFVPSPALLDIPIESQTRKIGFFGRVEIRKGVLCLAEAIPQVLAVCPDVRFKFVGGTQPIPNSDRTVTDLVVEKLGKWKDSVEFTGKVDASQIPVQMGSVDVAVFPSVWENFPCVCLEAMAAGRGIVGSSAGGMAEMLDYGKAGVLAPPRDAGQLARALIGLIQDDAQRKKLGSLARKRLVEEYNSDRIGKLMEESYLEAVKRRQAAGPRAP